MKKDIDKEVEICDCCEVHENLLQIVNETIPEENELYDLAELFKVFWRFYQDPDPVCTF